MHILMVKCWMGMGLSEIDLGGSNIMVISDLDKILVEEVFVIVLGAFGLFVCSIAGIAYVFFSLYERMYTKRPQSCGVDEEGSNDDS